MDAKTAIILAFKHMSNGAAMQSSAILCHADAVKCLADGKELLAKHRAVKSLAYSVGIFHADYQKASQS